ncbi:glycine zipper family protein [Steroidobacter flavus]|uniref:Glycine zipper family protein n=1 Tax=Steroidobacter flavus TaxID=1842136 RepID=A0ABV8SL84_9GAMM
MDTAKRAVLSIAACLSLGACASTPPTVSSPPPAPPVAAPAPPPAQDSVVYAYPLRDQTPEQQDRDRYECHLWAVKQSGFDPSAPNLPQHTRIRVVRAPEAPSSIPGAAVTGAVLGAIIGGPHASGEGAAVGAIAGAAVGAATDAQRDQRTQEISQARSDAQRSRDSAVEQKAGDYRRAIAACFAGRGYSTN